MHTFLLVGLFVGSASAVTYSTEIESSFACKYDGNQQEMNACALRDFKIADAALNKTYQVTLQQLSSEKKMDLRQQQRAWLKRRDSRCKDAVKQFEGGSIWPLEYCSCLKSATEARSEEVKRWAP